MAECKECLYYEVCADFRRNICKTDQKRFEEYKINSNGICDRFDRKYDFVKVVRCKDCVNRVEFDTNKFHCELTGYYCGETGYCSDGTPKERGGEK